jgi:TPP-dependent pyruvate/acetoin dehydrogenase alpha subunit
VKELTQPQGHSTSGSHERYKNRERLEWEKEHDCIAKMREWILNFELEDQEGEILKFVESEDEIKILEKEAKKEVSSAKRRAWSAFIDPIISERKELLELLDRVGQKSENKIFIE